MQRSGAAALSVVRIDATQGSGHVLLGREQCKRLVLAYFLVVLNLCSAKLNQIQHVTFAANGVQSRLSGHTHRQTDAERDNTFPAR